MRGRGSRIRPADWQGMLGCTGLAHLTELNGMALPSERRAAVHASLDRVMRRKATAHVDLR